MQVDPISKLFNECRGWLQSLNAVDNIRCSIYAFQEAMAMSLSTFSVRYFGYTLVNIKYKYIPIIAQIKR